MIDLGAILLFLAALLGLTGVVLVLASLIWGDRRRDDLFISNLTATETIRLGRNLLLWGVILFLLATLIRLMLSPPGQLAGSNAIITSPAATPAATAAPTTAVPAAPANAPPSARAGSYQAICVPPNNGGLNLRNGPDNAAAVLLVIPCNATGLQLTGAIGSQEGGQWVPINYNGTSGWVFRGLIQPSQSRE
jgi:Bacterial SH3 domain